MQEDSTLSHTWQRCNTGVFAFKHKFGVDLVMAMMRVFLDRKFGEALELSAFSHTTCWVGGEVEHKHLATRFPSGFDTLGIDAKLIFSRGAHSDGLGVRKHDARAVRNVARFVVENLIPGIEYRAKCNVQSLRDADRKDTSVSGW